MKVPSNILPNFIIGGVNNGGTSFLYSLLKQHPEIYMPRDMRPEPSFFYKSWEYGKGLEYYSTRWFSAAPKSAIAIGEKSTNYLFGGAKVAGLGNEHWRNRRNSSSTDTWDYSRI